MSFNRKKIARAAVALWLVLMLCWVGRVFWQNELVYNLPTPVPTDFEDVAPGTKLQLAGLVDIKKRPTLLHFFNPDCPCSRFNIKHVQSLMRKYGDNLDFAIVVLTDDKKMTAADIKERFDIDAPVYFDADIATRCGVISTPQAVLLDADGKLFYKGNYNKSRYCTDSKSDYARMAIDSLMARQTNPNFNAQAFVAYGCELPSAGVCKKNDL